MATHPIIMFLIGWVVGSFFGLSTILSIFSGGAKSGG